MEEGITVLETQVVVLKLGMISIRDNRFEAEIQIRTTWQEPKVANDKRPVTLNSGYWMPVLSIKNVIGQLETLSMKITNDPLRKSFLILEVVFWGKFGFESEEYYFPLDIQCLRLLIYCANAEHRKVLITNSLNLLHYIRHDFQCLSTDFTVHDVIDSATLSDQNYHRKNFSILRITFYVSRVLRDRNLRWLTYPFLFAIMTMIVLCMDNMGMSDQMFSLLSILIFLSLARRFLGPSYVLSVMSFYWWCLNMLSTLSLLWCGLQFKKHGTAFRVILLILYPCIVCFFTVWFYIEPAKRKKRLVTNSLIYKAALINLHGHEIIYKRKHLRSLHPMLSRMSLKEPIKKIEKPGDISVR